MGAAQWEERVGAGGVCLGVLPSSVEGPVLTGEEVSDDNLLRR